MRLQSVVLTNEGMQVMYLDEADIHTDTGVMEAHALDIPHAVLPDDLLAELVEAAETIVEHIRVLNRQPLDSFKAPR